MRCIVEYDPAPHPPVLKFYIHGAPHRRIHKKILEQYREEIWEAAQHAGIRETISHPVELTVVFINPTGPDIGNIYLALEQALDGKTGVGPTILEDDRLVSAAKISILFT